MSTPILMSHCGPCSDDPCQKRGELAIDYDWSGTGMRDLDTRTDFLGAQVGWSCGSGSEYLHWTTSDNTAIDGAEHVDVEVDSARAAGLWVSSVTIDLAAGWYAPASGSGPALVRVTYKGVTKTKQISPGSQSSCASTSVGTITVYDDGTFTLN